MKILICGAGIAGLALAQRMLSKGWEVCIVEHAPGPRNQGYMLDFIGSGYDAAEAMGVLPRLKRVAYQIDEVAYVDGKGRRRAHLDYTLFARLLDGRLLSILRPDLETALREELTDGVDLRFGCGVAAIDNSPSGVSVTLTDGTRADADLLVGADGVHSTVRRLVFGPEQQFFRYLGFHAAAYIFDDPEVHRRLRGRFRLTDSTNRLMGLYGLRDGRIATFCVHRAPDPMLPADPRATLRQIYGSLGWVVPRALDRCPPGSELYYDQVAQVVVPEWTRDRVALVGDACQAVSLLAGQGASLAVAGAYVLGELLATAASMETALTHYERVWRPVVDEKQRVGRRGAQWFLPKTSAQVWGRRIMLAAGSLPLLDRYIGNELVGKSNVRIGDLTHGTGLPGSVMATASGVMSSDNTGAPKAPLAENRLNARAMFARSPSLALRILFAAPGWLYRLRLGRLLGHRFMLLTHRGRTSRRMHQTVLEVVHHDASTRESIACSAWGTRADWYRNITANRSVAVETGGHRSTRARCDGLDA